MSGKVRLESYSYSYNCPLLGQQLSYVNNAGSAPIKAKSIPIADSQCARWEERIRLIAPWSEVMILDLVVFNRAMESHPSLLFADLSPVIPG